MDTSVNPSSNSSLHPTLDNCLLKINITAPFITYILFLPLFILVLFVGYQRWRKQHSVATAAMMSHVDVFTFNMVVLELISVFGSSVYCYVVYTDSAQIYSNVGVDIFFIISPGQTLFHLLTCVERYLAVVHPITYRGLRQAGGVRIRNISIGCVWLVCFASVGLSKLAVYFIYNFVIMVISAVIISFCSVSVLCILIRPGPGEGGGNRQRFDQSKQRALYTMMAIMGALSMRFLIILVSNVIYVSAVLSLHDLCFLGLSAHWLSLPSSLVLPLLFLHRAGKLPGCKHNTA